MALVMVDQLIEEFNALPKKTIINAISSDTDRYSAILELIDNSYTSWIQKEVSAPLSVDIDFNSHVGSLIYRDNAGGMDINELKAFLTPGDTTAKKDHKGVSLYGVGAKRSSFFISDSFEVRTRRSEGKTLKVEIDPRWLDEAEDWRHKIYQTEDIESGSTQITFNKVKFETDENYIADLIKRISSSFPEIIGEKFKVMVNGKEIPAPGSYEWLYAIGVSPVKHVYDVNIGKMSAKVTFTVGLMAKSSQIGLYGFDIICNGRLIAQNLRDPEIGFKDGDLGNPHARFARFKGIISFEGPVGIMPWNSTKTGLDYSKQLFLKIRGRIVMHSKPYVRESSRMINNKGEEKDGYVHGPIDIKYHGDVENPVNDYPFPDPAPRTKDAAKKKEPVYIKKATQKYALKIKREQIYGSIIEGIDIANFVSRQERFDSRNRQALIILDNTCELMLKKFLKEKKNLSENDQIGYFKKNTFNDLLSEAKGLVDDRFNDEAWELIKTNRVRRNELNHLNPDLTVSDNTIKQFRIILINLLGIFFGIDV